MNPDSLVEHDRSLVFGRIREDIKNHLPWPQNWPSERLKGLTLNIPSTVSPTGVQTLEDVNITLVEPVLAHDALPDRQSFVYAVKTSSPGPGHEYIAKFSYGINTRWTELELLEIARLSGVGHLPGVHAKGDHCAMSDDVRRIFYQEAGAEYEDCTLRSIVYSKYLPLDSLFYHSPQHIPTMAYQLIDCVHDLRYKANILHRNISANNVMYEYRGTRLHFVLINFDTATILTEDYVPSPKRRAGTYAFMAVDLIWDAALAGSEDYQPIPHMLRHEFESIFWLSLWCTLVLVVVIDHQHRQYLQKIVGAWETRKLEAIANSKFSLFTRSLSTKITLPAAAVDARLDGWFLSWTDIWREQEHGVHGHRFMCERAKLTGCPAPPSLDEETAGGIVSRENLRKELTLFIPDPYENTESL